MLTTCPSKIFLFLIFTFLGSNTLFAQNGTSGSPYTALGQARHVTTSGIYHFNISGTTFSSYVEASTGWILVASGDGSTAESSYSRSSALTLQSDAVLPAAIYSSTLITEVRMNSTGGPGSLDVTSSDADVLANLRSDNTLSDGTNSGDWAGTGTARLARSCNSRTGTLATHIYHACGNTGNMHWQVGKNSSHEKIAHNSSTKNDLNLWMRAASVPLPVELLYFDVKRINQHLIGIEWQTASEINNDYFTVERSADGEQWEELLSITGAGNSNSILSYQAIDPNPYSKTSYYRLKQVDFDGKSEVFNIIPIDNNEYQNTEQVVYPNPCEETITLNTTNSELEFETLRIYNTVGENVTADVRLFIKNDLEIEFDMSSLPSGVYFIMSENSSKKIYKRN